MAVRLRQHGQSTATRRTVCSFGAFLPQYSGREGPRLKSCEGLSSVTGREPHSALTTTVSSKSSQEYVDKGAEYYGGRYRQQPMKSTLMKQAAARNVKIVPLSRFQAKFLD